MAPSWTGSRYSWDEFHDNLRDINFWLNGYSRKAYIQVMQQIDAKDVHAYGGVYWCVGVGPMASFRRAISSIALELLTMSFSTVRSKKKRSFSTVIKVHLKPATPGWSSLRMEHQLTFAVAEQLGILDQECIRLADRLRMLDPEYIKWERDVNSDRFMGEFVVPLENHLRHTIAPLINKELSSKSYLLSVENLYRPINLVHFSLKVRLPPPSWNDSIWFISTTSRDVYEKSKSLGDEALSFGEDDCIAVLIPKALHLSAKHIFSVIRREGEEYWHHIALRCFHYAMLLFATHSSHSVISDDELIYQWAVEEILPQIDIKEEETGSCTSKCANMLELGRVILETFQEYSLLQLPFSPANEADEATQTAAHFLAYHGLIAEGITVDELSEDKKWISFMGDHGWHVSREWLSQEETSGPTALILREGSEQSLMFSKLDRFLPKLHLLRVLDLSYTQLKSLPSSVGALQILRLLSLRACSSLETLFSSSSTTNSSTNSSLCSPLSTLSLLEILDMNGVPFSHLTQEMGNQKRNLIYLDMSSSEVTTFPTNFFLGMSNLEKLILNNCSNLVELPNSMTMLSNLMTLEITGTQIRYFPEKIFAEMQRLQLLKLIKNKKLICLPESLSGAHNLIELHIEGWESTMLEEIKLEGYPALRSFVLIGAPRIRRLSLCTCRMLESVEFKGLSALEELYLSATAIKEVPADIPNLPLLRRFTMMGFPSRLRFPWHKLQRLPDVFFLDHQEHVNPSDQITQVCISDPWFFYSFNETARDLVRDGRFFQSFYVQISPCTVTKMLQDEERMLDNKLQGLVERQSAYVHVYSRYEAEEFAIASPIKSPLCQTDRHVDIPGMQQDISIHLKYLLQVTRSLSVTCDTSISSLSYLSNFDDLEECDLRWCNKMEIIFGHYEHKPLNNLRNMHVCNLKSLLRFSDGLDDVFSKLEHIQIQCCPRLEDVSPCQTALPCLKTLDILFCYNLKSIFVSSNPRGGSYQLPSLQRIRLQELPLLQHLDDDNATIIAPMWKELHVRGCWSLHRLPCLQDQSRKVKVNGERSWWRKLRWDSPLHRDSYEPELPPEFASFDESAEMTSYLR